MFLVDQAGDGGLVWGEEVLQTHFLGTLAALVNNDAKQDTGYTHIYFIKVSLMTFIVTCKNVGLGVVPALLHAQTNTRGIAGLCCGHVVVFGDLLVILMWLLCRDVGHAEDTGLYVETLSHLRAGILHGHYGYLPHLVGTTCNLNRRQRHLLL